MYLLTAPQGFCCLTWVYYVTGLLALSVRTDTVLVEIHSPKGGPDTVLRVGVSDSAAASSSTDPRAVNGGLSMQSKEKRVQPLGGKPAVSEGTDLDSAANPKTGPGVADSTNSGNNAARLRKRQREKL